MPLWAWPLTGLAIGFAAVLVRLAVGRATLLALAIVMLAVTRNPWTRRQRRLDRIHRAVAASKPLLR